MTLKGLQQEDFCVWTINIFIYILSKWFERLMMTEKTKMEDL